VLNITKFVLNELQE